MTTRHTVSNSELFFFRQLFTAQTRASSLLVMGGTCTPAFMSKMYVSNVLPLSILRIASGPVDRG